MRSSTGSGLWFDDEEDGAAAEAFMARHHPPEHELPVTLPVAAVLGRGDDAVVALLSVRVHTTGLLLDVAVRVRDADPAGERLMSLADGFGPSGGPVPDEERLWLGVECADGRRATRDGPGSWGGHDGHGGMADDALLLVSTGGGGSPTSWDSSLWLTPVPPPGDLVVVVMCGGLGVPETRTVLDLSGVDEAVARVERLWEPRPAVDPDRSARPPEPPAGSWFATMEG